jgi:glutamate racemase
MVGDAGVVVDEKLASRRVTPVRDRVPDAPIGIFDSGFGGLSVYRDIRATLPGEDVIFFADTAYCPYGSRTPDEILWRSDRITRYLIGQGAKIIVVACNTASAVAIEYLRATFPGISFIGLEPAVKPAAAMTQTGNVGVLATPRTVTSARLHRLIEHWANGVTVHTVAGEGMVELVESGTVDGEAVNNVIRPLLDPLLDSSVDVVVLGCTHYPFLRRAIRDYVGPGVQVIDSGTAVARRTLSVLQMEGLLRERGETGIFRLMTNAGASEISATASQLLGRVVQAGHAEP